jgi:hypothetical protein
VKAGAAAALRKQPARRGPAATRGALLERTPMRRRLGAVVSEERRGVGWLGAAPRGGDARGGSIADGETAGGALVRSSAAKGAVTRLAGNEEEGRGRGG